MIDPAARARPLPRPTFKGRKFRPGILSPYRSCFDVRTGKTRVYLTTFNRQLRQVLPRRGNVLTVLPCRIFGPQPLIELGACTPWSGRSPELR